MRNLLLSSFAALALATGAQAASLNPAAFNLVDNGPLDTDTAAVGLDVFDLAIDSQLTDGRLIEIFGFAPDFLAGDFDLTLGANEVQGDGIAIAADADSIEILFELTTATGGITQGRTTHILASITPNSGLFASDPLADLPVDFGVDRDLTVVLGQLAPVSLPTGIVFSLTTLGGLAVLRRRHS